MCLVIGFRSPAGEIVVSSAAAPSPNTAATTPEAGSRDVRNAHRCATLRNEGRNLGKEPTWQAPAAPSIAIIEEDREEAQAWWPGGLKLSPLE